AAVGETGDAERDGRRGGGGDGRAAACAERGGDAGGVRGAPGDAELSADGAERAAAGGGVARRAWDTRADVPEYPWICVDAAGVGDGGGVGGLPRVRVFAGDAGDRNGVRGVSGPGQAHSERDDVGALGTDRDVCAVRVCEPAVDCDPDRWAERDGAVAARGLC